MHETFQDENCREKDIAYILSNRSNSQRQEIKQAFTKTYKQEILEFWKNKLEVDFYKVVMCLMQADSETDAKHLHNAIKGLGTNEKVLVEILLSRTYAQIQEIKLHYKRLFKKDLEKDVAGDTSGNLAKIFKIVQTKARPTPTKYDKESVITDAKLLSTGGDAAFLEIFTGRSWAHLQSVFDYYDQNNKTNIEAAVKKHSSGDYRRALMHIVAMTRLGGKEPAALSEPYAEKLHHYLNAKSVKDKDKDGLVEMIAGHCERDLADIQRVYKTAYNKTLQETIKEKIKGDMLVILLTLL